MAPPDPGPPADERAYAHLLGLYLGDVSAGIRRLHTDTLDKLGVEWRPCTRNGSPFDVSVARQASVALMDTHVGPTF